MGDGARDMVGVMSDGAYGHGGLRKRGPYYDVDCEEWNFITAKRYLLYHAAVT